MQKSVWRYTEGLCHCVALLHYHFSSHESRGWAQTLTICVFHETLHIKIMTFVLGAPSQYFRKDCVPTLKQHFFSCLKHSTHCFQQECWVSIYLPFTIPDEVVSVTWSSLTLPLKKHLQWDQIKTHQIVYPWQCWVNLKLPLSQRSHHCAALRADWCFSGTSVYQNLDLPTTAAANSPDWKELQVLSPRSLNWVHRLQNVFNQFI